MPKITLYRTSAKCNYVNKLYKYTIMQYEKQLHNKNKSDSVKSNYYLQYISGFYLNGAAIYTATSQSI